MENWFEANLGEKVKLRKVWVIRGKSENIGIECVDRGEIEEFMRRKSTLKGGDVYIDQDTTFRKRRNRQMLRAHAREVQEKDSEVKNGLQQGLD